MALGPGWRRGRGRDAGQAAGGIRDAAGLTQLATAGLDGLDGYFTSYLPALMLAIAVPVAVLVTIAVADPLSGVTVAVTLPLVPLFGALIGMVTGQHAKRRLTALANLAHHFHRRGQRAAHAAGLRQGRRAAEQDRAGHGGVPARHDGHPAPRVPVQPRP